MDTREKNTVKLILCAVLFIICAGAFNISRPEREVRLRIGIYAGSYWNTPGAESYQFIDHVIDRFEEMHENITVEYVSGISADDYSEWLAEQIVKGTDPDVYFVLPEDFSLLVSAGALARLNQEIVTDPDFNASEFYESCMKSGRYNGLQYALPYESAPVIMFVNKTLLKENGIEMPESDWTWNDFYSICEQVTDLEQHRYGVYGYTWVNAVYSNGGAIFSEDGRQCLITDQNVQQAIRFVKNLENLNQGYTVSSRDFDLGNVAFRPFSFTEYRAYQPYPWRVKKYTGFEWDGISMPAGPNGDNVSEMQTMLVGISSRTRHMEEAWELIKLLCADKEMKEEQYLYSSGISPLRSAAENEATAALLQSEFPDDTVFDKDMISQIMENAVVVPRFRKYSQAMTMAGNAVAAELDGSARSGLFAVQREINQFLERN